MRVFVSYARQVAGAITGIKQAVQRIGHEMWFDNQVSGGWQWWTRILEPSACGKALRMIEPSIADAHEVHSGLA
jgi:hypothetical protein